jgi:homoserine O-acetyltransferase
MNQKINPSYHTLKNFKFVSGEILEEAVVEYITFGNPKYDKAGKINNAIVYCHGWSGDFASVRKIDELTSKGEVFDKDKYFFISLSCLGSPGSFSPSTSNLGTNFPEYVIKDMVNFQIAFLKDKFNISHLKGIIGNSMGGFEVLTWASNYPDYMDFVISLVSSYKVAGHNYALFKQMNNIIESDKDYNQGNISKRALRLASESMYPYGLSREFYRNLSNSEIDLAIEEMSNEGLEMDLNDIIYRNNASMSYDIEEELNKIIAKVLIVAINQDQYFPPELDAIPMSKMIKNSKLVIYDSLLGHVGSNEIIKIKKEINDFIKTI